MYTAFDKGAVGDEATRTPCYICMDIKFHLKMSPYLNGELDKRALPRTCV